jgi:hypothetical protein
MYNTHFIKPSKIPFIYHHIIWCLSRVITRSQVLLFTRQKKTFIHETGRPQGHVQKSLQECLYLNRCVIPVQLLSPTPSDSSGMRTTENTDDTKPVDKGDPNGILL